MLKLRTTFIVILMVFFISLSLLVGCKKEASYITVIRNNPNGTVEQWKTNSNGVTWNGDGSVTLKPLNLSHKIRIIGCLTVFSTKIVVDQITEKEVKKSDSENGKD